MQMFTRLSKTLAVSAVAAAFVAQPAAATEYVKMSTLGPGSSPNLVMTTFATIVNQKTGGAIEVQVNATGAATKHAIEAAQGKIEEAHHNDRDGFPDDDLQRGERHHQ